MSHACTTSARWRPSSSLSTPARRGASRSSGPTAARPPSTRRTGGCGTRGCCWTRRARLRGRRSRCCQTSRGCAAVLLAQQLGSRMWLWMWRMLSNEAMRATLRRVGGLTMHRIRSCSQASLALQPAASCPMLCLDRHRWPQAAMPSEPWVAAGVPQDRGQGGRANAWLLSCTRGGPGRRELRL